MSGESVPRKAGAAIAVTPVMLHDLANHLTIALGNADLLVLEAGEAASRPEVTEIRDACRRAVDLVTEWRTRLVADPDARRSPRRASPPRARVEPGDEQI